MSDAFNLRRLIETPSKVSDLLSQIEVLKFRVASLEQELLLARAVDVLTRDMYSTVSNIADLVAQKIGVSVSEIRSDRKDAKTAKARHIVTYLACKHTDLSTPRIGRYVHKDHTTVIYGRRRIERLLETEPDLKALIEEISTEIQRNRESPELAGAARLERESSVLETEVLPLNYAPNEASKEDQLL